MLRDVRAVYSRPGYVAAAIAIAVATGALLVWSSAIITVYPTGGVFIDADLLTLATIVLTSVLLAVSLPLHWYAWRRSVGSARARGVEGLAALLSVSSLSCCAPLLIPGVLSVVGVSGTSILSITVHLHAWRLPLFALALLLLAANLAAGFRGAAQACRYRQAASPRVSSPPRNEGAAAARVLGRR